MGFSFNEIRQFINFLWPRRKTKYGLALIIIFLLLINYFFQIESLNNKVILFGIILSIVGWWFVDSGRIILPSKKITIAFALKAVKPESHAIIEQTILKLDEKLKSLRVGEQFRIIKIGTDIFSTNEQAEKFIQKKKIQLVIHGNVWNEKKETSVIFDLKNFFFSFIITAGNNSKLFQDVMNDVHLMLSNRDWRIEEVNAINDLDKVSNNLLEIVLAIVAIAFAAHSESHVHLSISLMEHLLPHLDKYTKPEERKIEIKDGSAKISINLLRSGRLRTILHDCYINVGYRYNENKEYPKAIKHFNRALELHVNPKNSYAGLARASYHLNNIKDAIFYTEQIRSHDKFNHIYYFNMGFLSIINRKYDDSIEFYGDLRKHFKCDNEANKATLNYVIHFLNERILELPKEKALIFAKGILTFNFKSKIEGKELLKQFYELAKNIPIYKVMVIKTALILKL